MRILFCNYEYPPLGGGGGVVMAALARELARRHEVVVLTSRAGDLPAETVERGVRILRVPVLFRRHLAVANLPSMLAYLPAAAWRAARLRRALRFDVVNTHFAVPTGPVGQWIADLYKIPNVLSVHGGDLFDPSKWLSPYRHAWMRGPIRRLLQRADSVIAQSNNTLDHVKSVYGVQRRVELIPLGIERPPDIGVVSGGTFGLPDDAFVVLTIGRLVARKQTTQLVVVLARSNVGNAHLLVIGSGPDDLAVRRTAAELGVAERVHMLGKLSEGDKFRALAAASIFASTSQHEGFGLVFLEAMAFGLPVICYDNGGQTDFLATGTTGYVLRLNDIDGFAGAIRRLSESADVHRQTGRENARRVQDFFLSIIAQPGTKPSWSTRSPILGAARIFLLTPRAKAPDTHPMCGIAGIVQGNGDVRSAMARMMHALRHRGPDGEGTIEAGGAIFGHRRLSIIDLEGGRQPQTNADQSIWLVCNGEIYNYRALRAELEQRGYRFQTQSDCEVIIALYEEHGDRLLAHLRGMFAFALWDVRRRRLMIARDHLGQKPLYYARTAGGFAFASEIKGLLAYDPSLREMDLEALDQYPALRLIAPPRSMFRRIRKLPPGHLLKLEDGMEPAIRSNWNLEYLPKLTGTDDELADTLEERLEDALRLHLVSDVPVGAFLSGGLDSSLLVAMLAKRIGVKKLPTFTVGLNYQRFDEAPHARSVARLYGTEHHERALIPSLLRALPEPVYHLDEPSDPLSLCAYQVADLASEHVKDVIGGDGGDELFGGYDRYYGNLYASRYALIPESVRRHVIGPALSLVPESGWYKSKAHQVRWLHELSFLNGAERYAASLSYFYFNRERRLRLFTADASNHLASASAEDAIGTPYNDASGDPLDKMLCADSKIRLPDHPVMITDRMSMAHGLEARSPFMDHRLAGFAARLPSRLKVRGRSLRIIQRNLAARYLPAEIIDRPKQGFSSALPYILQTEYRSLYEHVLTDSRLAEAGVLRPEPIRELIGTHLAGRADHGNRLWLLINAELWYRMMILGHSREAMHGELAASACKLAAS